MEKIKVSAVGQQEAASALRAAGLTDTDGQFTPETLAASGQSFNLETSAGKGVFVAEVRGNHLWIHGAGAVGTSGMTKDGMDLFDAMAKSAGCKFVAFETARRGLERIAKKNGYRTTAVVMKKRVS